MPGLFFVGVVAVFGLLTSGTVKLDTTPPRIDQTVVEARQPADALGFND